MAERLARVGVPQEAFLQVEELRGRGDELAQYMLEDTAEELVDELAHLGAIQKGDQVAVTFFPDDRVPWDSSVRYVQVSIVRRDYRGQIIPSDEPPEEYVMQASFWDAKNN